LPLFPLLSRLSPPPAHAGLSASTGPAASVPATNSANAHATGNATRFMMDLLERFNMRRVIFTQRRFVFQRKGVKISRSHGAGFE
jgi:hypothetical protein